MKNSNIKHLFGVWTNKDSELVITEKMMLFYLYKGTEYISALITYELNENRFNLFTKAVSCFNKSTEKAICKYFNNTEKKWKEIGDKYNFPAQTYKKSFLLNETKAYLKISNDDDFFLKLNKKNNILTFHSSFTNNQNLEQIEKIEMDDFNIGTKATKETVGQCLAEWSIGSVFNEDDKKHTFAAQINTNKHSYIFSLNKLEGNQILYCRAARIRSNNYGSVFAQNIRLMKNSNEFSANMVLNNLETSKQSIVIKNHLFNPKSCVFVDGGNEIYWSLKDFSEDIIILNGCGDEEYKYIRPISRKNKTEYFKYVKY